MTIYDVYIGELGEGGALDWGGSHSGNIPRRKSPFFPYNGKESGPYRLLIEWIKTGKLEGRKVDWGGYAARADIGQIREFLGACYGVGIPADIAAFVDSLPDRQHALAAVET
jgi:hypothetical protein